jgi:hypothetical protein
VGPVEHIDALVDQFLGEPSEPSRQHRELVVAEHGLDCTGRHAVGDVGAADGEKTTTGSGPVQRTGPDPVRIER